MLAFASSYTFNSFFKSILLVIVLGLGHSLLLLPVILSFIGPRRTSKPRVFVPISSPANRPPGDAAAYKAKTDEQRKMRLKSTGSVIDHQEQLELMPLTPMANNPFDGGSPAIGFEYIDQVQLEVPSLERNVDSPDSLPSPTRAPSLSGRSSPGDRGARNRTTSTASGGSSIINVHVTPTMADIVLERTVFH